jgi:hypothetical protein
MEARMQHLTAEVTETRWDETPFAEHVGGKLSQAEVESTYTGGLEGTGILRYLMSYLEDGTGTFVGLERITGHLDGRRGAFVVLHDGSFDTEGVRATLTVVDDAAAEGLAGLSGTGTMAARYGEGTHTVAFDVTFGSGS